MIFHKHEFRYLYQGFASLPKINVPESRLMAGTYKTCDCGKMMFYPDCGLPAQEIENERD